MSLVELAVWGHGTVYHRLVVSEKVTGLPDRYAKVSECVSEINDLLGSSGAVMISDPKVAVSTVDCFLLYQSIGVWLAKCRIPVRDFPVRTLCIKLAST